MNIVTLQTFLTIVETGSLVRASEKLNVTQSTVTARLRGLEEVLGQTLLNRHKSGATLTPAGTKLLRYAEVMTGLWRQARQETSLPEGTTTICNFGCHIDLWAGPGRSFFETVNRIGPHMAMSASHGGQETLNRQLELGLIDIALGYQATAHGNRTIHRLRPERLALYATRPDNPIRFTPDYIYVDLGDEFRDAHAAAYSDAGISRASFDCAHWACDFLLHQGGSAYLPERIARPHLEAGGLFHIAEAPEFTRNVYLVTNDVAAAEWPWLEDLIAGIET